MDRQQSSQVLTGVLLIALGLIFLADRFDFGVRVDLGHLWPVILLVLGFGKVIRAGEDGRRGGVWLIFLGVLFLLHTYGVMTIRQSWPLFIVAGGVSLLFARRRPRAARREPADG